MPKFNRSGQASSLSQDEYLKIRLKIKSFKYKLLLDIAWFTGERWGAIIQLKFSDVYIAVGEPHSTITFRAATRKRSPNRTAETRQVPTHPMLFENLAMYKPDISSIWMFPGRDACKHTCWKNVYNILMKAVELAGFQTKGISTHSTRRSFITNLHGKGYSPAKIKKATGHKSIQALERYIDVTDEQVKEMVNSL